MKFVYYAMLVLRTVQLENVIPFDKKYIIDVIKLLKTFRHSTLIIGID